MKGKNIIGVNHLQIRGRKNFYIHFELIGHPQTQD